MSDERFWSFGQGGDGADDQGREALDDFRHLGAEEPEDDEEPEEPEGEVSRGSGSRGRADGYQG
jgi:hypothetical protein